MAKVGRPNKYKKKYCEMIVEHFNKPAQVMKKKTEYYSNGNIKSESEYPVATELPTFQSFADKIEVDVDTLLNWRNEFEEFFGAYARAKQLQEHIWLVNGMSNLYNSQFAQFFGKNCLGYKDKTELDLGNKDDKPFKYDFSNLSKEDIENIIKKEKEHN